MPKINIKVIHYGRKDPSFKKASLLETKLNLTQSNKQNLFGK